MRNLKKLDWTKKQRKIEGKRLREGDLRERNKERLKHGEVIKEEG